MQIYKVYTDFYDGADYMVKLYTNIKTAEEDLYKRRENGDNAYIETLDIITDD